MQPKYEFSLKDLFYIADVFAGFLFWKDVLIGPVLPAKPGALTVSQSVSAQKILHKLGCWKLYKTAV